MTLHKLLFAIFIFIALPTAQSQEVMRSSLDPIPANWKGKRFDLNKNYPSKAADEAQPWKKFDFKTQPEAYINAVKQYVLEGNLECDWVFQKKQSPAVVPRAGHDLGAKWPRIHQWTHARAQQSAL